MEPLSSGEKSVHQCSRAGKQLSTSYTNKRMRYAIKCKEAKGAFVSTPQDGADDLRRHAELLWGRGPRPSRGPKPGLSVDQIVREAISIADAEGLEALSMQRLANQLGASTMALYRYVPGKDELILLMIDTAVGQPPATGPDEQTWRTCLERWASSVRDMFMRHHWILPIATRPRLMGPNEASWYEGALAAVSRVGLTSAAMLEVAQVVNAYVRGSAQASIDRQHRRVYGPLLPTNLFVEIELDSRYPILQKMITSGAFADFHKRPPTDKFEAGLQRVLDGIETFIGAQRRAELVVGQRAQSPKRRRL